MPRKKMEEAPAVENAAEVTEAAVETAAEVTEAAAETAVPAEEAPAEKPKRTRRKKTETAAEDAAPAKKTTRKPRAKKDAEAETAVEKVKKAVTRRPRKKAVVPNFVIQNVSDQGITYEEIVEKVKAATVIEDVQSVDIYVKAEEGKAYYVINGEAAGAVDLF